LSVEEAKLRLRQVAAEATPAAWIRENPWDAVAVAFAAGVLAGLEPEARKPMASALAQFLSLELAAAAQAMTEDP
jgi:uncharacterized protein (DUF2062 family)